ncbi:porin [Candidatus Laterigemmans baculatus]|uniref:porin n=1 Tax=Candidatus Laterigemmans baculatus TaxID=2770505 RepID=UPI0013DCA658|nr:porin [Candidatus Laterigemmans baculatus]
MKLSTLALLTSLCAAAQVGAADGQQGAVRVVGHQSGATFAACDCGEVVCGCEEVLAPACGCEGMVEGGCDGACGGCASGCDLGDPFRLIGEHGNWSAGGWIQMGYHNNDIPLFNQHKHNFNLHQAWLYAEKAIDTSCGFDIGGRIDYVYGVDAQDTQAFGTNPRGWDNDWDNGIYGHALPQVYLEAGYGDLAIKAGHFYTLIGYESVMAPNNFFYSHAYTMYLSEPFTHTGALATYQLNDRVTLYGGYTLGWDSGFDDNGDNFIGGITTAVTDRWNLTYATVGGRFGEARFNGVEKGYMHSVVSTHQLTEKLQYVFQSDVLSTEDGDGATVRDTFGINQYLLYALNDCWSVGGRFEWYEQQGVFNAPTDPRTDIYATTVGLNYRPHANVLIRPELRYDHDEEGVAGLDHGTSQTTFGFDTILTF